MTTISIVTQTDNSSVIAFYSVELQGCQHISVFFSLKMLILWGRLVSSPPRL